MLTARLRLHAADDSLCILRARTAGSDELPESHSSQPCEVQRFPLAARDYLELAQALLPLFNQPDKVPNVLQSQRQYTINLHLTQPQNEAEDTIGRLSIACKANIKVEPVYSELSA